MKEEWRAVPGYEGLYEVSNMGRVRSLDRVIVNKDGVSRRYSGFLLSTYLNRFGRVLVSLWKNNRIQRLSVHRLVANAFIPNPDNLPEVNHKDENPQNNRVDNLEWCTKMYNLTYGSRLRRISEKLFVPVIAIDGDGNEYYFPSMKEAGKRTGASKQYISALCRGFGRGERAGGYKWRYATEKEIKQYSNLLTT